MGRIAASVKVENPSDCDKMIRCDALVDTGASHMILPTTWRERLGSLEEVRQSQALVDMFGHRLVHVKRLDLK